MVPTAVFPSFFNFCDSFSLHARVIKFHLTVSLHLEFVRIAPAKPVHFISMTIHADLARIKRLDSCCPRVVINSITFHLQRYSSLNGKCNYTVNLILVNLTFKRKSLRIF